MADEMVLRIGEGGLALYQENLYRPLPACPVSVDFVASDSVPQRGEGDRRRSEAAIKRCRSRRRTRRVITWCRRRSVSCHCQNPWLGWLRLLDCGVVCWSGNCNRYHSLRDRDGEKRLQLSLPRVPILPLPPRPRVVSCNKAFGRIRGSREGRIPMRKVHFDIFNRTNP